MADMPIIELKPAPQDRLAAAIEALARELAKLNRHLADIRPSPAPDRAGAS